jgi:hypothetical protein
MPDEIIASHLKSFPGPSKTGYGQNGDSSQSSLTPGETKSPIADVSPPQVDCPALLPADQLSARVKMDGDKAAEITPHSSMAHRGPASGSPGGHMNSADSLRRDSGKTFNARTGGR